MLPQEVRRQIRLLQFRARRAVAGVLGGEYHSVFKGAGIAFEEVREYQPGDDIRAIDWTSPPEWATRSSSATSRKGN
jgi:uncharacterized protein (DUF58 family)